MNERKNPRRSSRFNDLMPWGDPYIVALVEKLRRSAELEEEADAEASAELPPPFDNDDADGDGSWQADWPRRENDRRQA